MSSSDDTEKKFNSIMGKLLVVSKPKPSSNLSSSKKRPNPNTTDFSMVRSNKKIQSLYGNGLQKSSTTTPRCRPWERADFIKRLSTFKSMTWFGKPKVVDAVNCARRGWINVDLDSIACESCGARLLFSTPASWSHQQVEKAAQVFSLKLDNGHKTSCPWIDNSCDEKLAQFPPMADQELVDGYKQRLLALSELVALPMISTSATSHLKSPELEQFLRNDPTLTCDDRLGGDLEKACLGNVIDTESAKKYYEAQMMISLCGWEPQSLPYVVDCENQSSPMPAADTFLNVSESNGGNEICVYSKLNPHDRTEAEEGSDVSLGLQLHPNSSSLDCKLCGASIGLWAFSMIPRPLEFHRFVGYSEVNGQRGSEVTVLSSDNQDNTTDSLNWGNSATGCCSFSKDQPTNLNLTIAGGPPPTKQNFRARISLPAIGRSIRARLFSDLTPGSPEPPQEQPGSDPGEHQDPIHSLVGNRTLVTDNLQEIGTSSESHDKTIVVRDESLSIIRSQSAHEDKTEKDEPKESALVNGMGLKRAADGNKIEFDPVRQHRYFCPWITSTSHSSPGWKLVLSALLRQNGYDLSPSPGVTSSSKFIEVDDPISSIRRLFASPSPKRRKKMPGSS